MNTSPLISIIIPVYNTENWLNECIDSVLNQTYQNFEILLIDDGSTDSSGAICDEYALLDNRVKVFHKPNGGVSSARNKGLEQAGGKWVAFVDADDTISENYLSSLLPMQEEDFIMDSSDDRFPCLDNNSYKGIDAIQIIMDGWQILGPWGKLYKLEIIRKNNILYDESLSQGEDTIFNLEYVFCVQSVRTTSSSMYFYRKDVAGSLSKKQSVFKEAVRKAIYVYRIGQKLSAKYSDYSIEYKIAKYAGITWTLWNSLLFYKLPQRSGYVKYLFRQKEMMNLFQNYLKCEESGKRFMLFYVLGKYKLYSLSAFVIS